MNLKTELFALLALLVGVSCRELPLNIGGDKMVASVEDMELRVSDLRGLAPEGLSSEDSTLFVARYAEKWIQNSVKLLEAERVFASSAPDIDKMVEEYRNSLMIRKLEKHHTNENFRATLSEGQIEEYYAQNSGNFPLTTRLVKGRILTLPKDAKDAKEMLKQMSTLADKKGGDFRSICEKKRYDLVELTSSWVEYSDFLSRLPIVRRGHLPEYISKHGVQQLEDAEFKYYFQITEVMNEGDAEPLERVKDKIIYILNNRNQSEFLRQY
ncbi:MAG: hypothetical protein SNI83_00960 [Rikenellaceae bacterium]